MQVRNLGSWAGLNFSHNDGEILELPDDVAEARVAAGLAEKLKPDEVAAEHVTVNPSPDIHPDHVPGAFTGGVTSVANPNHRPGMSFVEGQRMDVEAEVKAKSRRGKDASAKASAPETAVVGTIGTNAPSVPAAATLEGNTVTATTGAGAPRAPQTTDSGSGHSAEGASAANAQELARRDDAGPAVTPPTTPAAVPVSGA